MLTEILAGWLKEIGLSQHIGINSNHFAADGLFCNCRPPESDNTAPIGNEPAILAWIFDDYVLCGHMSSSLRLYAANPDFFKNLERYLKKRHNRRNRKCGICLK